MVKGLKGATRSSGKTGGKGVNSGRGRKVAKKLVKKNKLKATTKPVVRTTTVKGNTARSALNAVRKRVATNRYRISGENPLG